MKKSFHIEVDCANCAAKMESSVNTLSGIVSAAVNFMTQKLTVEFEDGAKTDEVMKNVLKACRKIDSDCEIEW